MADNPDCFFNDEELKELKRQEEEERLSQSVKRIKDLIDIRNYMASVIESPTVPKKEAYQAINMLPSIDKKIFSFILSDEFKAAVGFDSNTTESVKSALKK